MKLTALTFAATIFATSAMADMKNDIARCQEYAGAMAGGAATQSGTSTLVTEGISILGSVIAGRNPGYAVESAMRRGSMEARQKDSKYAMYYESCMREVRTRDLRK